MLIVGERINSTRERIARAIEEKDSPFIQDEARKQAEAGADYIDVNAGAFFDKEREYLPWLVKTVQEAVARPLCLDSANPEALKSALKAHRGKALVNSITAESARYGAVLPLLKEYDAGVIALCMDSSGIPPAAEGRFEVARKLIEGLMGEGIPSADIFVDPVVQPISVEATAGQVALQAIRWIREHHPQVHIICGLSNVSFGLPRRSLLNQTFAAMAVQAGIDAAILDPCDKTLMAHIVAAQALEGQDPYCQNYIGAYRRGRL
jgi:5-methyltetrahydrofolate--homocysteine methyltransferase